MAGLAQRGAVPGERQAAPQHQGEGPPAADFDAWPDSVDAAHIVACVTDELSACLDRGGSFAMERQASEVVVSQCRPPCFFVMLLESLIW